MYDPRDSALRYIGLTTRKLSVRLNSHWADPGSAGLVKWFDELRALGLKPQIATLETCARDIAGERETHTITFWQICGADLLNVLPGGNGSTPADINAAMRAKISAAKKGMKHSLEWRENNRAARLGKKRTPESCAKQSATTRGRKQSADHIAKRAAANRGKKRSVEYCEKASDSRTGRKMSLATRAKMQEVQKLRRLAEKANGGIKRSPEACARMKEAQQKRWQK